MKVYLQTLTPLHIGTGEKRLPVEYIIEGKNYYPFSEQDFIQFIEKNILDINTFSEILDRFIEWIDEISSSMANIEITIQDEKNTIKDIEKSLKNSRIPFNDKKKLEDKKNEIYQQNKNNNQVLQNLRERFDLMKFAKDCKIDGELKINLAKNIQNAFFIWGEISRKKEIAVLAGHSSSNPHQNYIAGSSIKGAIRTALIFAVLQNDPKIKEKYFSDIESLVKDCHERLHKEYDFRKKKDIKKRFEKQLEAIVEQACYCDGKSYQHSDEKYDILKFLQITDARFSLAKNGTNLAKMVSQTGIFVVKKQKENYEIQLQTQTPCLEVWNENIHWEFDINVNLFALWEVYLYSQERNAEWKGIENKLALFYGINTEDLVTLNKLSGEERKQMIEKLQIKAENYVIHKVKAFYELVLAKEKDWVTHQIKKNKANYQTNKYHNSLKNLYTDNTWDKHPIMRLGFAAGFPAHTEYLFMLSEDFGKELMTEIMSILELGNARNNRDYTPNPQKFPKSRIFLINNTSEVKPLGWCSLSTSTTQHAEKQVEVVIQETKAEPILYAQSPIKKNSIVKGKVLSGTGAQKSVELYLYNNEKQIFTFSYQSDAIIGKLCQFVVTGYHNGKVNSITFKGFI